MFEVIIQKEYEWVSKVLVSSENENQINSCVVLFNNLLNKWYSKLTEDLKNTLISDFYHKFTQHYDKIVNNDDLM